MRAAVVRNSDGFVANLIEVNNLDFPVAPGHTLRRAGHAGPGWIWNGRRFTRPVETPAVPTKDELLVTDVNAALTINDLKAALVKRFVR